MGETYLVFSGGRGLLVGGIRDGGQGIEGVDIGENFFPRGPARFATSAELENELALTDRLKTKPRRGHSGFDKRRLDGYKKIISHGVRNILYIYHKRKEK